MLDPISVLILIPAVPPEQRAVRVLLAAPPQREDLIYFEAGNPDLPDTLKHLNAPIVFKVTRVIHRLGARSFCGPDIQVDVIRVDW